jgi:hypothetical protein
MTEQPRPTSSAPDGVSLPAAGALAAAVCACALHANLSFAVADPAGFLFFPPFERGTNANRNSELGAEYFNIARSLTAGRGFANPFPEPTGPTAWMPPVLPLLLAGLLRACDGNKEAVMAVVIFLQVAVLAGTGLLTLALARRTTNRVGPWAAAAVFLGALLCQFHLCFQLTHDCWLVLLALDLVVAGWCWWRPLDGWLRAAAWGLLGGLCALVNPVVALAWGVLSVWAGRGKWSALAVAVLAAGLTLTPWTLRNYLVFGRLIPVKSNLAYELYQSECLQPDGLPQSATFKAHPIANAHGSRREYKDLGETAFLDGKGRQFWAAVRADPEDFAEPVASRLLGATLWYVPLDRDKEPRRPLLLWLGRLTHPGPFLALLLLVVTAVRGPLHRAQWTVIAVYVCYLLPYVAVSYYERYAMPLVGAKALLVIWGADRLMSLAPRRRSSPDNRSQGPASART